MAQVSKISSFKSFTEVKNQEATMKLREENNAKRQETVGKIGAILDEMGLTSLSELDEVKKQALINKMFGNVSEDEAEDIEDEINKLGEPKNIEEGNAFIYAAAKAKNAGKKTFSFNGKTYKVTLKTDTGLREDNSVEEIESIDEARSIAKIQYDWSKVTTSMQATAQNWKAAEGAAKESLLGKLKEMTAQKKALEAELDAAIADKDKDIELVVTEAFYRLPKDVIGTELYTANQNLQSLYINTSAGSDVDPKALDSIIKNLQQVKSLTKKFNNKEEVVGTVYEGKDFKSTKDFLDFLEEIDGMPEHRIRRIMGKDYIDTPGGFRDEADDYDNDIEEYTRSNMGNKDFEKLRTWWENNVAESLVNEGSAKQFDVDFNNMVRNIKSGYGWIDPEYVADTWENSSDSIDFELVKGEIYKRLIAAKLLAYADDEDEETAGQYVKSLKELGINESLVNEAASTAGELASFISQNAKHFASFLKPKTLSAIANGNIVEIKPGSKSFTITVDFDKKTIDTTGKPEWPESTSYIEIMEYVKTTKFKLNESVVNEAKQKSITIVFNTIPEKGEVKFIQSLLTKAGVKATVKKGKYDEVMVITADDDGELKRAKIVLNKEVADEFEYGKNVNEAEIKSDDEFKEYAMTVLKKAFGDEFDEAKAGEVVDGILKKCGDDYGACVGMLTSSLGESFVTEGKFKVGDKVEITKFIQDAEHDETGDLYDFNPGVKVEITGEDKHAYQFKYLDKLPNERYWASHKEFKANAIKESVTEAFDANKRVIELAKLLKKQKFIGAVYPEGDTINVFVDSGDTGTTMMWDDDEPGKVRMECEDDSYSETIDDNNDAILNFFSDLDDELDESVVTEAFDANYWEDYHEDAPKITNPTGMQIQQEVEAAVEEWNDNNENGEENEVTPAGEKKVLALAKQFAKAKGYICHDVIDAMIAQES